MNTEKKVQSIFREKTPSNKTPAPANIIIELTSNLDRINTL